ncbi:hypothetical protein R1sor_022099 [Riccia sorocarpa]|uniref:Uncharacterized protein n=1 Tax=Riccia sorocarpa TaxID=122646 RepID=A0ABD3GIX3_9MARC
MNSSCDAPVPDKLSRPSRVVTVLLPLLRLPLPRCCLPLFLHYSKTPKSNLLIAVTLEDSARNSPMDRPGHNTSYRSAQARNSKERREHEDRLGTRRREGVNGGGFDEPEEEEGRAIRKTRTETGKPIADRVDRRKQMETDQTADDDDDCERREQSGSKRRVGKTIWREAVWL